MSALCLPVSGALQVFVAQFDDWPVKKKTVLEKCLTGRVSKPV